MSNFTYSSQPQCIIVMGVSGCGKSTVGKRLATHLDADFIDGDDLHPPENIRKMSQGLALDDNDRRPWLARIQDRINQSLTRQQSIVVVCSSLKKCYRDTFRQHTRPLTFAFLDGSFALIRSRMLAREGHFMKTDMLQGQFDTLERPDSSETDVLTLDIRQSVDDILSTLQARLT